MRVFVFSSLLVLALTGCKPFWDPTYIPSGYTNHGKEYKSPPGPEARNIGYEYSAEKNAEVIESWRQAAADMVLRAKANNIRPSGPVFLITNMGVSASQSAFDLALRQEVSAAGHNVVRDSNAGTALFYSIAIEPLEEGAPEGAEPYTKLTLGLLDAEGELAQNISALYELPLYGAKSAGFFHPVTAPVTMHPAEMYGEYND